MRVAVIEIERLQAELARVTKERDEAREEQRGLYTEAQVREILAGLCPVVSHGCSPISEQEASRVLAEYDKESKR